MSPVTRSSLRAWFCRGLILLLLGLPLVTNPYVQFVINSMLIYTVATLGFNIVIGNLGQLAFANIAFFGIGAYGSAILAQTFGVPWLFTVPLAAILGAAAGFLASAVALRGIRLYYLAIITLAFGEFMRWLYLHLPAVTGGTNGMPMPRETLFGLQLALDDVKFYFFLAITIALIKLTINLMQSRIGRAIAAVRENEIVTASLGIPAARIIVLSFMWSGLLTGSAGAMFAQHTGHVFPEAFGMHQLIIGFAMVLVGGLGSIIGSALGAITLTALPEYLRAFPGMEELFFGLAVVVVLLLLPGGLASLLRRLSPLFIERHHRESG